MPLDKQIQKKIDDEYGEIELWVGRFFVTTTIMHISFLLFSINWFFSAPDTTYIIIFTLLNIAVFFGNFWLSQRDISISKIKENITIIALAIALPFLLFWITPIDALVDNPNISVAYFSTTLIINALRLKLEKDNRTPERISKNRRELNELREEDKKEKERRDSDIQNSPFMYKIATHANEALAIRYGIANTERDKKTPSSTIQLQKLKRIQDSHYEVLLTDYRNRKARAVIEPGTNYIKTFYPLEEKWFEKQAQLELTLKGNGSFTLKELATFHIQKAV